MLKKIHSRYCGSSKKQNQDQKCGKIGGQLLVGQHIWREGYLWIYNKR
jgi:hypothetical protein